MFLIAQGENVQASTFKREQIHPTEETGTYLKIDKVIKHLQELRALGYSIINELLLGNGRLADDFIRNKFRALPSLLLRDIMILPNILDKEDSKNDDSCSEQLNEESFDLCMNLLTLRELQPLFIQSGANLEFLKNLKQTVEDCELGSNHKMLVGQLTQVIREISEQK